MTMYCIASQFPSVAHCACIAQMYCQLQNLVRCMINTGLRVWHASTELKLVVELPGKPGTSSSPLCGRTSIHEHAELQMPLQAVWRRPATTLLQHVIGKPHYCQGRLRLMPPRIINHGLLQAVSFEEGCYTSRMANVSSLGVWVQGASNG